MKLSPFCDYEAFLAAVQHCSGDVYFMTSEGDVLNLKSELCRYVFAVVMSKPHLLENSTLRCANERDISLLKPFLE